MKRLLAIGWILVLAGCAARPELACGVQEVGSVPVVMQGGVPVTTLTVNGVPLRLVFDTGAQLTAVSAEAAERAHLPTDIHIAPLIGVGGRSERHFVRFDDVRLGTMPIKRFLGAAGVFGSSKLAGQVFDGFLGVDVLGHYDIDLDLPHQRAVFYTGQLCNPASIPWTLAPESLDAYARPADYDGRFYLRATVNGAELTALFDTGAAHTLMSGAAFARVPPPHAAVVTPRPVHLVGLGNATVTAHVERFGTIELDGGHFDDPVLLVDDDLKPDLLLGSDYASRRRVWLSFSSAQVFVDRAGPP